jgi:hypothetical protein
MADLDPECCAIARALFVVDAALDGDADPRSLEDMLLQRPEELSAMVLTLAALLAGACRPPESGGHARLVKWHREAHAQVN